MSPTSSLLPFQVFYLILGSSCSCYALFWRQGIETYPRIVLNTQYSYRSWTSISWVTSLQTCYNAHLNWCFYILLDHLNSLCMWLFSQPCLSQNQLFHITCFCHLEDQVVVNGRLLLITRPPFYYTHTNTHDFVPVLSSLISPALYFMA